jgi:aldehyde:ferredoxin oxidoreductase
MNFSGGLINRRIAIVDLEKTSIIQTALTAEMAEFIGGAAVNTLLLEKFSRQMPLVLGTGPLTGGFAPASCLMAASFPSKDKGICHVPVVIKSGPMLKLSGIDFVVFTGQAPRPCVVVISKGNIQVETAENLAGMSIPATVKRLKARGMKEIALVTGPDAHFSSSHHSAVTSVFGGFDRCGLAGYMASKNIRAIVINGGGEISFADKDLETDLVLTGQVHKQLPKRKFFTVLEKIIGSNPAKKLVKKYFLHSHACFHCPVGCINFLKTPDTQIGTEQVDSQGVFILDHQSFSSLAQNRPKDAHILMKKALAMGVDPLALAEEMDTGTRVEQANEPLPPGISIDAYQRFGGALPQIIPQNTKQSFSTWEERVAFSMIVGVCPIPQLIFPTLSPSALMPFITRDKDQAKIFYSRLEKSIQKVLG